MAPWLDEELANPLWCLGATVRCTPAESLGIWAVVFFYSTVVLVTVIHSVLNDANSSDNFAGPQRRRSPSSHRGDGDDMCALCLLVAYFFAFAGGCLAWALGGTRIVHPYQSWQVQILGSAIMVICSGLLVAAHGDLGRNWSPVPHKLEEHELVTTGLYRWARHPMYAVFLWAAIGTLLATLNWIMAWCVSGFVAFTLRRIPAEERDMLELFGREYSEYRDRVPALGFPFVGRWWWHQRGWTPLLMSSTYSAR